MKYVQDLFGLKVIEVQNGEEVGSIIDIVLKTNNNQLAGIILEKKGNQYLVPQHKLYSLGEDYIVIKDKNNLLESDLEELMASKDLLGKEVVTNTGKNLGIINDILLTDEGKLDGYELSAGLVDDILEGRNVLTADNKMIYGQDKMIIKDPLI